jgi:hypothetical protein
MTKDVKDEEMICGLTADEQGVLREGLRSLPDTVPPRAVWHRIREQAEAEGLIRKPAARRPSTWYAGLGMAAAIVLAVLVVPGMLTEQPVVYPTTPDNVGSSSPIRLNALQTLMTQSRELESNLRDLPAKPRVMSAGTADTIAGLEDRIAAIDYQLNDPESRLSPEDEEIFWRERVRLMKLLVGMRYAQAQRTAF